MNGGEARDGDGGRVECIQGGEVVEGVWRQQKGITENI